MCVPKPTAPRAPLTPPKWKPGCCRRCPNDAPRAAIGSGQPLFLTAPQKKGVYRWLSNHCRRITWRWHGYLPWCGMRPDELQQDTAPSVEITQLLQRSHRRQIRSSSSRTPHSRSNFPKHVQKEEQNHVTTSNQTDPSPARGAASLQDPEAAPEPRSLPSPAAAAQPGIWLIRTSWVFPL